MTPPPQNLKGIGQRDPTLYIPEQGVLSHAGCHYFLWGEVLDYLVHFQYCKSNIDGCSMLTVLGSQETIPLAAVVISLPIFCLFVLKGQVIT